MGVRFLTVLIQGFDETNQTPSMDSDIDRWQVITKNHIAIGTDPQDELHEFAAEIANRGLALLEIDQHGLDEMDKRILEAVLVNFQHRQRFIRNVGGDAALAFDLGVIADAAQEIVRDARGAAAAPGDLRRPRRVDGDGEQVRRALDDAGELLRPEPF
jgi:hypothetical protein